MKPATSRRSQPVIAMLCSMLITLAACTAKQEPEATSAAGGTAETLAPASIAWFQGSIEDAFALAEKQGKPLFLYWGAEWCPYCKELEATIFTREEFIRMSGQFVTMDMSNGDSSTIRQADRLKIYGLPTVLVFNPAGEELTRIRGGMNVDQYAAVLELTLNEVRPVVQLVAAARAGETLQPSDWQLLADYSWEQDRGQALGDDQPSAVLLEVLAAAPAEEALIRSRLSLAAMAVWLGEDEETRDADLAASHLAAVEGVMADPDLARANMARLAAYGMDIVELADEDRQPALQQSLLALYKPAVEDGQRHLLQRASVLSAWAEVATMLLPEGEALDEPDIAWARERADTFVAALDSYQVHAGVNSLWGVYYDMGLDAEARQTLALGIEKSRAPYYFMSGMGSIERKAENTEAAIGWYRKAWEATSNPLDRVRWGSGYVRRLIQMTPDDTTEIQRASQELLADMTTQENGLDNYQRGIQRLGQALQEWSEEDEARQPVTAALRQQMDNRCATLEPDAPGQAACEGFLQGDTTEAEAAS